MSKATNITWHPETVTQAERQAVTGSSGVTLWMCGLSGSGKSTIAVALEHLLHQKSVAAYRLDGDNIRHGLCSDLGFSESDRLENIRRVAHTATLMNQAGLVVIVSLIAPTTELRAMARSIHQTAKVPFLECFVDAPLDTCIQRDPKGLYAKAIAGEIANFTGISAPFEAPQTPEVHLETEHTELHELVATALDALETYTA